MPLSRDNAIVKADIAKVVELKEFKVFLLVGTDDTKLVIKTDAGLTAGGVKAANSVVKAIDASVKSKILDAAEKAALLDWIKDWEEQEAWFKKELGKDYRADEKDTVANLKEQLNPKYLEPWIKMAAMDVKDLNSAIEKRLAGDKSEVKAFIATLTAKGGLEKLGQVIAADLFNGNTDRFLPAKAKGNRAQKIGGQTFEFRCLVNVGNVFVAMGTAGLEVSALDYVDPQSPFKDITAALAGQETRYASLSGKEGNSGDWPAKNLTDKKKREAFASDVVGDLELVLNPHKSKFSLFTKLGKDASSRIAAGMVAGAIAIKKKLETKYKAPMTGGVKERYDILALVK